MPPLQIGRWWTKSLDNNIGRSTLRHIDMETWPRRQHFQFFHGIAQPHAGLCANVDISLLRNAVKQGGYSINTAIIYVLTAAANAVPEFRQRIRGDDVIEHEIVHPATTILAEGHLFSFCTFGYTADFAAFAAHVGEQIAYRQANPSLEDEPGRDDLLFLSAVPWVSFTAVFHPMRQPVDSIPRITWGKFFEENGKFKMPLSVQGHHALMDGFHMGQYYETVQAKLDRPNFIPG